MTLIIAMDMGKIGLIASDKAEVMINSNGDISPIHQEAEKIVRTPLGVITGAGRVELLDQVKNFVKAGSIHNTDQVLGAILQARKLFKAQYSHHHDVSSALSSTSWVFNYTASLDDDNMAHRIAMFHPFWGVEGFRILGTGQAICISPSSFTADEAEALTKEVQAGMQMPGADLNLKDALLNNVRVAVEAMANVSIRASSVSEVCDIAVVGESLTEVFSDVSLANWERRFAILKQ